MAFNPMQQQQSPDMLMAMMTDPRATPQQRMAAMSALNTMRGGANAPQPPQMTGDGTGVSDMDPAFMAAVRQEMMGQGPEEQPEIPQRQAAPEAQQNPSTEALMSGAADASRVAAMAHGGAVKGYAEGEKVDEEDQADAMFQNIANLNKPVETTSKDKYMALLQAGLGTMAAASQPGGTFLGSIGQGGLLGIKEFEAAKAARAQERMKQVTNAISLENAKTMGASRGAMAKLNTQKFGLNEAGLFSDEEAAVLAANIDDTGNPGLISKAGVGLLGNANRRKVLSLIQNPDLANQALTYGTLTAQAAQTGRNIAGPEVLNPSSGQMRNIPTTNPQLPARSNALPVSPPAPVSLAQPPAAALAPPPSAKPSSAVDVQTPAVVSDTAPVNVPSEFNEKQAFSIIPKLAPESQPMTPQAKVRMDDREKALAKVESDIDQGATSAINANYLVNNLSSQASDFKMGKFAPIANKSREYLLGFNNLIGNPISEEELNKISSETGGYQAFQKNAIELARQVVRATSARAAYQEMQMIMNSLPSTEMTEQGFRIVSNQLQGANDFRIAAQRAKELYKKQNDGRLEGFEDWLNKTVDPAVFMLHRMSPSDQDQLIKKLNKTNKSGLKTLLGQMENAEKLGLFESQI